MSDSNLKAQIGFANCDRFLKSGHLRCCAKKICSKKRSKIHRKTLAPESLF